MTTDEEPSGFKDFYSTNKIPLTARRPANGIVTKAAGDCAMLINMTSLTIQSPFDMSRVLVMVLAGGEGRRLGPLTVERAKPGVPFGGRYRIIDVVLSNFVNSGMHRIKVLTQYKSASLEEHIARAWRLSPMLDSFIETIPAQQRTGKSWYKGSADAVYQCQNVISDEEPEHVCVFGGDHVYKMDVRQMLGAHNARQAEATVAAIAVPRAEASAFGVLEIDENWRILRFHEKPANPPAIPGQPDLALASMGNYIFRSQILRERLEQDAGQNNSLHDFGHDILPMMVDRGDSVFAYDFLTNRVPGEERQGYWRDIGTVDSYYDAHMDLVAVAPQFNLYNQRWPVRTGINHDPPAKFVFSDEATARVGTATESIVSLGCVISGGRIHSSVLGNRCRVNSFSELDGCVLLGNIDIGRHAKLKRVIVDKHVRIPEGMQIGYDLEKDRERFFVSDGGVVVIAKRAKVRA